MARKTAEAIEKTEDDLETKLKALETNITITTNPVVVTGVQRKANIGNFETIDIYCAVAIPQDQIDPKDKEALEQMVKDAAEIGFYLTSKETSDRYQLIKEAQKKQ